jgi:CRISPR/Cas system CSM-associated protein Csm3 (group 7 of RAMP superfamily)
MLKKLVNEAYFTLRITTTGPLLVKSERATVNGPDMAPVQTFRNGQQEIYLPGSSLKGIFRSHVEKIVCSLKPHVVCYPFSDKKEKDSIIEQRRQDYRDSCGAIFAYLASSSKDKRRELDARSEYIYANSCPTCRLFGSTSFIGRLAISDAHLASGSITERRDGVGIDRL